MSRRYKVRDNTIPYFVTSTVVGWIDALSRPGYKEILLDSFRYCMEKKGLLIHAWVIMNNHIHLIISANGEHEIPAIMRDLKKYTCKKIINAILENPQESRKEWMMNMFTFIGGTNPANDIYQFWQEGYHPIALDTDEKLQQRLDYIHNNPVRAEIVWEAAQYKYSSAIDYLEGRPGLLDVELLY